MWQQILSVDGVRAVSGNEPTVLHFPSPIREDMTIEQRLEELAYWSYEMREPEFNSNLDRWIRADLILKLARNAVVSRQLNQKLAVAEDRLALVENELDKAGAEIDALEVERGALRGDSGQAKERAAQSQDELLRAKDALLHISGQLAEQQEEAGLDAERIVALDAKTQRLQGRLDRITTVCTWRIRAALPRVPGVSWVARRAGGARSD